MAILDIRYSHILVFGNDRDLSKVGNGEFDFSGQNQIDTISDDHSFKITTISWLDGS